MSAIQSVQERAASSFFRDSRHDPDAVRVCHGTACRLAEPARSERHLSEHHPSEQHPSQGVYCLGHCHRAPAVMQPDGRVDCSSPRGDEVRCLASRAVVTERLARGDCSDLERAREFSVYAGLDEASALGAAQLLDVLERSGEQGRGGAGFPTAAKWKACAQASGTQKYVVANGDEGDPGAFVDRLLMERDPHAILEGMALCALAVGARSGIVYVRSEYPEALARMQRAVDAARAAGVLSPGGRDGAFDFDVQVVAGAGSYVCGEETALLNALEGRRGEVRLRPPYPVEAGLHGCPTVVNNVETLVNVPWIVRNGPDVYRGLGTAQNPGTKALCLDAGFERPGVVEIEFGHSLRDVIESVGGGGRDGTPLDAVILGGPMGSLLLADEWDVPLEATGLARHDIELGHGGIVAVPRGTDLRGLLRHWLQFMADESCGRCVPCGLGSQRALELAIGLDSDDSARELSAVLDLMRDTSLCAFGQSLPVPVAKLLRIIGDSSAGSASA